MIVIAENLNTRNRVYMDAVSSRDRKTLTEIMKKLINAGPDMINLQCSLDGAGDEDNLPWVAEILCDVTDAGISLDSRNIQAIKKALPLCKKPPLINFISETEPEDQETLLSLVHIGRGMGQKHILNSHECIRVLKELIEPPVNTIAWISNVSTGLPKLLRKPLEATFLSYMAGAGLDAALG